MHHFQLTINTPFQENSSALQWSRLSKPKNTSLTVLSWSALLQTSRRFSHFLLTFLCPLSFWCAPRKPLFYEKEKNICGPSKHHIMTCLIMYFNLTGIGQSRKYSIQFGIHFCILGGFGGAFKWSEQRKYMKKMSKKLKCMHSKNKNICVSSST